MPPELEYFPNETPLSVRFLLFKFGGSFESANLTCDGDSKYEILGGVFIMSVAGDEMEAAIPSLTEKLFNDSV